MRRSVQTAFAIGLMFVAVAQAMTARAQELSPAEKRARKEAHLQELKDQMAETGIGGVEHAARLVAMWTRDIRGQSDLGTRPIVHYQPGSTQELTDPETLEIVRGQIPTIRSQILSPLCKDHLSAIEEAANSDNVKLSYRASEILDELDAAFNGAPCRLASAPVPLQKPERNGVQP